MRIPLENPPFPASVDSERRTAALGETLRMDLGQISAEGQREHAWCYAVTSASFLGVDFAVVYSTDGRSAAAARDVYQAVRCAEVVRTAEARGRKLQRLVGRRARRRATPRTPQALATKEIAPSGSGESERSSREANASRCGESRPAT